MSPALPVKPPLSMVRVGAVLTWTTLSCNRLANRFVDAEDDRRERTNDRLPAFPMVTSRVTESPGAMFVAETTSTASRLLVMAIDVPAIVVVVAPPPLVFVLTPVVVV